MDLKQHIETLVRDTVRTEIAAALPVGEACEVRMDNDRDTLGCPITGTDKCYCESCCDCCESKEKGVSEFDHAPNESALSFRSKHLTAIIERLKECGVSPNVAAGIALSLVMED